MYDFDSSHSHSKNCGRMCGTCTNTISTGQTHPWLQFQIPNHVSTGSGKGQPGRETVGPKYIPPLTPAATPKTPCQRLLLKFHGSCSCSLLLLLLSDNNNIDLNNCCKTCILFLVISTFSTSPTTSSWLAPNTWFFSSRPFFSPLLHHPKQPTFTHRLTLLPLKNSSFPPF